MNLSPSIQFDGIAWELSRARSPCLCAATGKQIIKGDRVYKPQGKSERRILAYAYRPDMASAGEPQASAGEPQASV